MTNEEKMIRAVEDYVRIAGERYTKYLRMYLPGENNFYRVEEDQNQNFEKIDGKLEQQNNLLMSAVGKLGEKQDKIDMWQNYALEISEGDLNDFKEPGNYISNNGANVFENNPVNYGGFLLECKFNKYYTIQTINYVVDFGIFRRTYVQDTKKWGEWVKIGTSRDLSDKQDKKDSALKTGEKTIVGAINELVSGKIPITFVEGFHGFAFNGAGLFPYSGEINFESVSNSIDFGYRKIKNFAVTDYNFGASGGAEMSKKGRIHAGDIFSNEEKVAIEKEVDGLAGVEVGGTFPITNATFGKAYKVPSLKEYYVCLQDYSGPPLQVPNAKFTRLSVVDLHKLKQGKRLYGRGDNFAIACYRDRTGLFYANPKEFPDLAKTILPKVDLEFTVLYSGSYGVKAFAYADDGRMWALSSWNFNYPVSVKLL